LFLKILAQSSTTSDSLLSTKKNAVNDVNFANFNEKERVNDVRFVDFGENARGKVTFRSSVA